MTPKFISKFTSGNQSVLIDKPCFKDMELDAIIRLSHFDASKSAFEFVAYVTKVMDAVIPRTAALRLEALSSILVTFAEFVFQYEETKYVWRLQPWVLKRFGVDSNVYALFKAYTEETTNAGELPQPTPELSPSKSPELSLAKSPELSLARSPATTPPRLPPASGGNAGAGSGGFVGSQIIPGGPKKRPVLKQRIGASSNKASAVTGPQPKVLQQQVPKGKEEKGESSVEKEKEEEHRFAWGDRADMTAAEWVAGHYGDLTEFVQDHLWRGGLKDFPVLWVGLQLSGILYPEEAKHIDFIESDRDQFIRQLS